MSAGKAKGTRWETAVVTFLRGAGFPWADRVPLSGSRDRGDVTVGPGGPVIECKAQQRHSLAEWSDEAQQERDNARGHHAAVWIKRRGFTSPGRGYVLLTGDDYTKLMRAAGFGEPLDGAA